jgi:hypothetical protein
MVHIEYHQAEVDCVFHPMEAAINKKFKGVFTLGYAEEYAEGPRVNLVAISDLMKTGQLVKTFFHEMTHVKQYLYGELEQKRSHRVWKGTKWPNKEYSYAPWEMEARAFSDKFYEQFLQREVNRVMQNGVNAYHPSVARLRAVFPTEEVFRLTQKAHQEREQIHPLDWEAMSAGLHWYPRLNWN